MCVAIRSCSGERTPNYVAAAVLRRRSYNVTLGRAIVTKIFETATFWRPFLSRFRAIVTKIFALTPLQAGYCDKNLRGESLLRGLL
jgi:hypothetical protein